MKPGIVAAGSLIGFICVAGALALFWSCAMSGKAEKEMVLAAPETAAKSAPAPAQAPAGAKAGAEAGAAKSAGAEAPASIPPAGEALAAAVPGAFAEDSAAETTARQQGVTRYLSADDSNSAASPVIARKIIRSRRFVPPALVRTYEFLNYYSFDYPAPGQSPVAVTAQMRQTDREGEFTLQVAVRSRDRGLAQLPPFTITFLLDVSGSMAGAPLDLARKLILGMVGKLRPGDRVSLITCNRQTAVLLEDHEIGTLSPGRVAEILRPVRADDVTDLEQGIVKAYELAGRSYDHRHLNRVVMISDGGANAGELALDIIAEKAEDADRQGIYLAGIGVGEGFNDRLMNLVTDKGRGAYLFIDSEEEIHRILADQSFIAAFDLAVKDVRLKMVMPPGWQIVEFHGEQISARAEDIVPQYLSANDQMIYHLKVSSDDPMEEARRQMFEFEVEYAPIGGRRDRLAVRASVAEMLGSSQQAQPQILKGDALVAYAEMLKSVKYPLDQFRQANLQHFQAAREEVGAAQAALADVELEEILGLLDLYSETLRYGERFPGSRDGQSDAPDAVLGLKTEAVRSLAVTGSRPEQAVRALARLLNSERLVPMEGYKFLAMSSGPVGNPYPAGSGELGGKTYPDPAPEFLGRQRTQAGRQRVYDLHQIRLELTAPPNAASFSFDFNLFSSEYPEYVNQNFNDTFYAILEAASTNGGRPTNIAFDANNNSIEVDNNYFQNPFHPIPNTGTGFDAHGSTGWLRTSWPIRSGERFTLTFSIHDEGDAIYDSLVVLDNFRWHEYDAVGTTDPLN